MPKNVKNEDAAARLTRLLREQNTEAVVQIYVTYGRLLYLLIDRVIQDSHCSEELVRQTCFRAWKRYDELEESGMQIGPWLIKIAKDCILKHNNVNSSSSYSSSASTDVADLGAANLLFEQLFPRIAPRVPGGFIVFSRPLAGHNR
jgi:DNA-directed RNA polymerase specialized sigma24 family protein